MRFEARTMAVAVAGRERVSVAKCRKRQLVELQMTISKQLTHMAVQKVTLTRRLNLLTD